MLDAIDGRRSIAEIVDRAGGDRAVAARPGSFREALLVRPGGLRFIRLAMTDSLEIREPEGETSGQRLSDAREASRAASASSTSRRARASWPASANREWPSRSRGRYSGRPPRRMRRGAAKHARA